MCVCLYMLRNTFATFSFSTTTTLLIVIRTRIQNLSHKSYLQSTNLLGRSKCAVRHLHEAAAEGAECWRFPFFEGRERRHMGEALRRARKRRVTWCRPWSLAHGRSSNRRLCARGPTHPPAPRRMASFVRTACPPRRMWCRGCRRGSTRCH